jgi:threonine synthase
MPAALPPLWGSELHELRGAGLHTIALTVARQLFGTALEDGELERIVRDSLNFDIPLVQLDERLFVLELFHGPTLAFKDVGARFLARLMACYHQTADRVLTVITATSGDTGGAVGQAFAGLPNTRVLILFPKDQVSPIQRRQFTTLGGSVRAVAVKGTFDDCQRLAKEALADERLRESLFLTSANSLNVGRLLPQIFYYFYGWTQLPDENRAVLMSVPSGNFGNLTAGLMAKGMGLPRAQFVAATNQNDVVPAFLRTGVFETRPSVPTISSAMDVGNPSNFPRILALYEGRDEELHRDVLGSAHTDDETRTAIAAIHRRYHYVLDPHSAVGFLGLQAHHAKRAESVGVFLATAHPAKFPEVVEPVLGQSVPRPERVVVLLDLEERATEVEPTLADVTSVLAEE